MNWLDELLEPFLDRLAQKLALKVRAELDGAIDAALDRADDRIGTALERLEKRLLAAAAKPIADLKAAGGAGPGASAAVAGRLQGGWGHPCKVCQGRRDDLGGREQKTDGCGAGRGNGCRNGSAAQPPDAATAVGPEAVEGDP